LAKEENYHYTIDLDQEYTVPCGAVETEKSLHFGAREPGLSLWHRQTCTFLLM